LKKIILYISILSILTPSFLYSGIIKSYGFKLGANSCYHDFGFLKGANLTNRYGFNSLIFVNFILFSKISLSTHIEYSQDGFRSKSINDDWSHLDYTTRFGIISIPLLINIDLHRVFLKPYFQLGPNFEIIISRTNGRHFGDKFKNTTFNFIFNIGCRPMQIFGNDFIVEFRCTTDLGYKNGYELVSYSYWFDQFSISTFRYFKIKFSLNAGISFNNTG